MRIGIYSNEVHGNGDFASGVDALNQNTKLTATQPIL